MLEPLDARAHELAVIIEERGLIERALLAGDRRHPVGAVLREQRHPFAKAPLVEEQRLVDEERFQLRAIDTHGA